MASFVPNTLPSIDIQLDYFFAGKAGLHVGPQWAAVGELEVVCLLENSLILNIAS